MAMEDGTRDIINNLRIASPCPMLWGDMQRTHEEAVRFCGDCHKKVYDVSKMSAKETTMLLQKAEVSGASICMQLYRRADGTILTDDCPVGMRRIRDTWRKLRSTAAAFVVFLCSQSLFAQGKDLAAQSKSSSTRPRVPVPSDSAVPPPPPGVRFGGMIPPPPILAGKPAMTDWRAVAMKNESVKRLADKIAEKEKQATATNVEKLEVLQLRYNMAQEASKQGIPSFALQELSSIQKDIQTASESANFQTNESAKRMSLMKDVLNAKMAASNKLGVTDTKCIQDELDKLK
ncbi:MAG: hypothetical protein P4L53_20730 [Candidatus Obscuribacterales bacterium]|nr:hypothetical protein [Candidatus Obscuribacterales bacterium]